MEAHSSVLTWRIAWTEELGQLQSTGSQRFIYNWSELAHTHSCLHYKLFRIFSKCTSVNLVHASWVATMSLWSLLSVTWAWLGRFIFLIQFSSVQSCPTLYDPMNRSMPGFPVHHQFPEFTQTYVHRVGDAIQPSHPLLSHSPPAPNPFHHQGLFQ